MASKTNRKRSRPIGAAKPIAVKLPAPPPPEQPSIYKDFPIRPLNNDDSAMVKDMFALSNNFAALMKKFQDTTLQERASLKFVDELKDGKIKGPLMIRASPNVFIPMRDMKKAADNITKEVGLIKKENIATRGQIEHRYEEYIDGLIRFKRILVSLIGDKELTTLSGHRTNDVKSEEEAKIIFQKEFEQMTKTEMQKLPEEVKDVIAKDKAAKKKCVCKDDGSECKCGKK